MAKITEYPEELNPAPDDVLLVDGTNGTRTVTVDTLRGEGGGDKYVVRFSYVDSTLTATVDGGATYQEVVSAVQNKTKPVYFSDGAELRQSTALIPFVYYRPTPSDALYFVSVSYGTHGPVFWTYSWDGVEAAVVLVD